MDEEKTFTSDWLPATLLTTQKHEIKARDPAILYFFPGAVYEIAYIKSGCFSTTQLTILVDLASENDLEHFCLISILVAPVGLKEMPS